MYCYGKGLLYLQLNLQQILLYQPKMQAVGLLLSLWCLVACCFASYYYDSPMRYDPSVTVFNHGIKGPSFNSTLCADIGKCYSYS